MHDEKRLRIKQSVEQLVERLAVELSILPEEVADVAFLYIQKHPKWGRNPSKTQKRASHSHWKGLCQACSQPVELGEAVFHHKQRRIREQHEPANLLPYHPECHDDHHKVTQGSLSKGAPKPKPRSPE